VSTIATPTAQQALLQLQQYLNQHILGQNDLVEKMLISLLANGHLIVEGLPGLAKTRAIKTLAQGIQSDFHRIQFTPDLLPSDITGSEVYRPQTGSFEFQKGPIFNALILADEINRAPAKVQSALLESMEERQVTIGKKTHALPPLFMVMATQNPIEQEGTYPLPEAQLDRFLMHLNISYPSLDQEQHILALARSEAERGHAHQASAPSFPPINPEVILTARQEVLRVHMSEHLESYLLAIILASRNPASIDSTLTEVIQFGASPRATIGLDRACKARAWLLGRDYVTPDDIQALAHPLLSHRLILHYSALAQGWNTERVIHRILERVAAP
jgi:MoxR-like ATPase